MHCSGGCQRSHARNNAGSGAIDTFLAMCDCARQPVPCSVRLARATNHSIPQLRMQIPFSDVHASAISILAQINLPGVSVPDVWQKKAESPPTSAPESGANASEHISTSSRDQICLDDIIAKLKTAGNEDTRAAEILAAAITLRDSSGRDRKVALRHMANAWGVTVNEKE